MYPINCVKQKCPRNKKTKQKHEMGMFTVIIGLLDNNFNKKEKR